MPAKPNPQNPYPVVEIGGVVCPVQSQAHPDGSHDPAILLALARLPRASAECLLCRLSQDCPVLGQFNQAIDIALSEITEQWNLKEIIRR